MNAAVQIIKPVNHTFQLQLESVKQIFESDHLKDRNVVIVSIAGAFRKGKSFLLNFFLKYLNAQYKKHDVTDWIGERESFVEIDGFKARGGRKPETTGIWMWSEVFTHDYPNGEKVAIALIDTQGIHDHQTGSKETTAIFAISMMIASVQCYNVSQQIQEDDLQDLELFTEYGRLATSSQTGEKPFQKLLFIIRDWPNVDEIPYGEAPTAVAEVMAENADQTPPMRQLRQRIQSSFENITAFLMPYPGNQIARGRNINGDLKQIDSEFIRCLKELVPLIFAPENLIVKKISGQKIRARDVVTYLQAYVSIFNEEGKLPEPMTLLMATASTMLVILCQKCLNLYIETMQTSIEQKSLNEKEPYFGSFELRSTHDDAKSMAMQLFYGQRKLGGDGLINQFRDGLVKSIDEKYPFFATGNERTRSEFKARSTADLRTLYMTCVTFYVNSMQTFVGQTEQLSQEDLQRNHETLKTEAMSKYETGGKIGAEETILSFQNKLESDIMMNYMKFEHQNADRLAFIEGMKAKSKEEAERAAERAKTEALEKIVAQRAADLKNIQLQGACLESYKTTMRRFLSQTQTFYSQQQLEQKHDEAKNPALERFEREKDQNGGDVTLKSRLESDIDGNFVSFSIENDRIRKEIAAAEDKAKMEQQLLAMQRQLAEMSSRSGGGCSIL